MFPQYIEESLDKRITYEVNGIGGAHENPTADSSKHWRASFTPRKASVLDDIDVRLH